MKLGENDVSRETFERLQQYAALLEKWTPRINLIARSTVSDLWQRHILDSAQVFRQAPNTQSWVDLGSGGGLPGVICAILAKDQQRATDFTLIESDQRKATFLRTVSRELGLDLTVFAERAESVGDIKADVLSARALAPLPKLLGLAHPFVGEDGCCLFLKGAGHEAELQDALAVWRFEVEKIPSTTNRESMLLKIRGLSSG